jgi:hypothetical protein
VTVTRAVQPLLVIAPKSGSVRRYIGRRSAGKVEIKGVSAEDIPELEYFRRYGWPAEPPGGIVA